MRDNNRSVRKIAVNEWAEASPLEICLDLWLQWQRRDDTCVGWRGQSAILVSDGYVDPQQVYDNMDNNTAKAVDAMVSSLPTHLVWAIRRRCGLATVWRFPSLIFADELDKAEKELEKKLKNNIATRTFFN
jgi:hypothetical protein